MDLLVAFIVVAVIGYMIMVSDKSKPECFAWCDVGKGLLMWSLAEATTYMIKGPAMAVKMVGGDGQDAALFGGIGEAMGAEEALYLKGGGGSIMSHVVKK